MTQINFKLENIRVDPPGLTIDKRHKVLINIDADFTLRFDDHIVLCENLNFLELLASLKLWKSSDFTGKFSFESSDFEDKGVFELFPVENGFIFRSCWAASTADVILSLDEVADFVYGFGQLCKANVQSALGINIERFSL